MSHRHYIIGTAGHVDHGKTALIGALTEVETDRLSEEKERGISIDLGFAPFRLPNGELAGVVDVPGHEKFVNNMLAGIGGIDMVLLVIDVNEGVMPQTREHLHILKLLEIPRGIVVLTKCDLAESEDWIDLVEEEIREELEGTFLENSPFCRISSVTRQGLPELVKTIQETLKNAPAKDPTGPLRLPLDRNFSISGFGTIVTGTLLSGTVQPGDMVEVLPQSETVRVREVQVHDRKVKAAYAGQRVALNLAGLEREGLHRGTVIATPGIFSETDRMDIRFNLLDTAPRPIKFRDPVHFCLGTARVTGQVILLDRDEMKQGESVIAQIQLDKPLVAHRQDRFIIRSYSPMTTIGGGQVLDPKPKRHKRFRPEIMESLKQLESGENAFILQRLSQVKCARIKELEAATGIGKERIETGLQQLQEAGQVRMMGPQWVVCDAIGSWQHLILEATARYHKQSPLAPGIPTATLRQLLPKTLQQKGFDLLLNEIVEQDLLKKEGDWVRIPDFAPQPNEQEKADMQKMIDAYRAAGTQVKNRNEMIDRLRLDENRKEIYFAYLAMTGELVTLSTEISFDRQTYEQAVNALKKHFVSHETLTLAQFRDLIGSSRKQTQAVLEYFDGQKFTRRVGDERVKWQLPE